MADLEFHRTQYPVCTEHYYCSHQCTAVSLGLTFIALLITPVSCWAHDNPKTICISTVCMCVYQYVCMCRSNLEA